MPGPSSVGPDQHVGPNAAAPSPPYPATGGGRGVRGAARLGIRGPARRMCAAGRPSLPSNRETADMSAHAATGPAIMSRAELERAFDGRIPDGLIELAKRAPQRVAA